MDKKKYSIIIGAIIIIVLVMAIICVGCGNKDDGNNDLSIGNVDNTNVNINIKEEDVSKYELNTKRDDNGVKINVSPNINKEKMTFDFLDLTGIELSFYNGETKFKANVVNNSEQNYPLGLTLKITFLDNKGERILTTEPITSGLPAGGTATIQSIFTKDCSYADTFTLEVVD